MISLKKIKQFDIREYISIKETKSMVQWLWPYVMKHKGAYIGLFILLFVEITLTLVSAWFIGNITDAAVHGNFERLKWLVAIGVGLSVTSITANFIDTYLETIAVNAIKRDLNLDLYKHILLLRERDVSNLHSGELLSHFTNDIHNVEGVIGRGLINLVRFPIISIASFIYLVQINWKLSLSIVLVSPIAIAGGAIFGILLRNNSRIMNELISNIIKKLNDTFHGFTVIRSFTLEKLFYRDYRQKNEQLYSLEMREAKLRGWFYAGSEAIGAIAFLISLIIGAFFVTDKIITIGALLTFINLVNQLISPLTGLAGQWAGYQRSVSALERITKLLNYPTQAKALPHYTSATLVQKDIQVRNLTFSYDESAIVFKDFNLYIPAGKAVALVGPSGAGKSTLFNLIQHFYEPHFGTISIDGRSIDELTISELRSSIAYVPQETFLFSGTIKDNLMIARPLATEEEMINAAVHANIHDHIMTLPNGYETEVGERGAKLSGGQRQRLAIARAILKDAPILLLDEATSALDSETEHLVKEALARLMINRTTIMIAHRLSTIQHADLIVVMDQGEVVQKGTHEELIRQSGMYRRLNNAQEISQQNPIMLKAK